MSWADILQTDHATWLSTRYVGQEPQVPLMGVIGEAGEAAHAMLNEYKEIKHGRNPRHDQHNAELLDAIGDCIIYACSWCNTPGVNRRLAGFNWDGRVLDVCVPHALDLAALLVERACHCYKVGQVTQGFVDVLCAVCRLHNVTPELVASSAWGQVKERVR